MDLRGLQGWVKDNFGGKLDEMSTDYGVARLLTQAGQLAEATLRKGDVAKEIADVMFVLAALANRAGVDMNDAIEQNLTSRSAEDFLARLDRR